MKRFWIVGMFLAVTLLVTACGVGPNRGNDYQKKYYQGYDSLEMQFGDNTPPYLFNYDNQGFNELPIVVTVKNKGASDAYGAIYIHGFDPHFVQIAGGKLPFGSWSGGVFTVSGGYSGISGGGWAKVGWEVPDGSGRLYGSGVFGPGGQLIDWVISINIGNGRIGSGALADRVLGLYDTRAGLAKAGWNSMIFLEGDTPQTPGGGLEVYEFPAYIYRLPPSLEEFRQPIMVTACYSYATRATAMMCIDPYPQSNTKKACYPRSVSMGSGQGAPVAVTRIDQQASNRKTVFTIYIQHSKKGGMNDVFDYYNLWKCNPESGALIKPTDKNVVYIEPGWGITLSGQPLQCSPDYKIRLDQSGRGQITCTAMLDGLSDSAYQAPLNIELWYGYSKNIYKEITIKKL